MIIIDYLQLMNASGMSFGSRQEEVSTISRSLKGLAKELNIPIIALIANAYHEDIQKCLAAGMNAHLSKPINIDRAVRTIIECARTAKENG